MPMTGNHNYFENFKVGDVYIHERGRTVSEMDNHFVTLITLNTAQAHFNLAYMRSFMGGAFPERLVMGGLTMALAVGLTAEDMSENALADLGYTAIRNTNPVFHGDTLFARSEVLEVRAADDRADAGIVRYKITAHKQDGKQVFDGERTILVKRRSHWAEIDAGRPQPARA